MSFVSYKPVWHLITLYLFIWFIYLFLTWHRSELNHMNVWHWPLILQLPPCTGVLWECVSKWPHLKVYDTNCPHKNYTLFVWVRVVWVGGWIVGRVQSLNFQIIKALGDFPLEVDIVARGQANEGSVKLAWSFTGNCFVRSATKWKIISNRLLSSSSMMHIFPFSSFVLFV